MSDREAFEKWVCDLNRAPTAWEAWQAAQAQTLLEVIRDDSGCPTEVRIAEALQHAGQGEAVAEVALGHGGYPVCRWLKGDEESYPEGTKLYTHPQPAVPDGYLELAKYVSRLGWLVAYDYIELDVDEELVAKADSILAAQSQEEE